MVDVDKLPIQEDYLETEGPRLFDRLSDIPELDKSYLLKDAAILQCLERVIELGFYS